MAKLRGLRYSHLPSILYIYIYCDSQQENGKGDDTNIQRLSLLVFVAAFKGFIGLNPKNK